jgi:hypothetical protein
MGIEVISTDDGGALDQFFEDLGYPQKRVYETDGDIIEVTVYTPPDVDNAPGDLYLFSTHE